MEIGTVHRVDIDDKMQTAYLDYAMSVIVSRALPDARDGLKPVQRRILYAMHDIGLRPDKPHKKSARIVGEVLGKYHPHGDAAVYDTMARMAQDFSLRYPLVDGQGNFGSIDGDSPAAMRYTEARMAEMSMDLLADLDQDTVDFVPNFDDTLQEPSVLPAAIPNLLVNGATGIAVGMSTSIPPHNLGEVCDALTHMLENWDHMEDITVEDLMVFIKGPDFPTGGVLYRNRRNKENVIAKAYGRGRGKLTVRALVRVEEMSRSRHRLVITELPYQVNKTTLIERIAKLVRDGRVEGITDLRDESDRRGMRLVIELTRTVDPEELLEELFKHTQMQVTFSFIMLALVEGEPRRLTLKQALLTYLDHRQTIVRRRSQYQLARARERAHILEGLLTALDNLDDVIDTIRRSRRTDTARRNLQRKFNLSEAQAQAILDMPLKRLAALERRKIRDEYEEKVELIEYLEGLLRSPKKVRQVVHDELVEIKERYADPRRTQIVESVEEQLTVRDLMPDEAVWIGVSGDGLVARLPDEGRPPRVLSRPEDAPITMLAGSTRDTLYLFTADGRTSALPVHELPEGEAWEGQGRHYADLMALSRRSKVVAALAIPPELEKGHLFFATRDGVCKRIDVGDLPGVSTESMLVMNVDDDDEFLWAAVTSGKDEVVLVTAQGRAIRFKEDEVRSMGLSAGGVMGVKLDEAAGDRVVAMIVVRSRSDLLTVTDNGWAKRSPLSDYPTQGRYGQGVISAQFVGSDSQLAGACVVQSSDKVVLVTDRGAAKTIRADYAPRMGRATRGDEVIALRERDKVKDAFAPLPAVETEEGGKK